MPRTLSVLTLVALALPALAQAPCDVKAQYDAAEAKVKKAQAELDALRRKSGNPSTQSAPDVAQAKADLVAAEKSLEEAEDDLKKAEKAKADFLSGDGAKIKTVTKQIADKKAAIKKANDELKAKKDQVDEIAKAETQIKTLEGDLGKQFTGLDVSDLDNARSQISKQVTSVEAKVRAIETRAKTLQGMGVENLAKAGQSPSVSVSDVLLKCPEVEAVAAKIGVQQRFVQRMLDEYSSGKAQTKEQAELLANVIGKAESGISETQKELLPAAKACETSLLDGLNRLSAQRKELETKDPNSTLRHLTETTKRLENEQKPLDRELERLNKESAQADTKIAEVKSYRDSVRKIREKAAVTVAEAEKQGELSIAKSELATAKLAYDNAVPLKDLALNSAIDALSEANSLLSQLTVTRAELRTRVAAWRTSATAWKAKAEAWKRSPNAATRVPLVNERQALRTERAQLVAINQSCQRKEAVAQNLRTRRQELDPYRCFEGVASMMGQLDGAVNRLIAVSIPPSAPTVVLARMSFRSLPLFLAQQTPAPSPACPPQADLEMDLEDLPEAPAAPSFDELRKDLTALEAKVSAWRRDIQDHASNRSDVNTRAPLAGGYAREAETLADEVQAAAAAFGVTAGAELLSARCQKVTQIREGIRTAEAEATRKAQELKQQLDAAQRASACSMPGDADAIRASYRNAIRLVGEIGVLEKRATADRNSLLTLKQEDGVLQKLLTEQTRKINEISTASGLLGSQVAAIEASFNRATELSRSLVRQQAVLRAELAVLEVKHKVGAAGGLPPALAQRIQAITGALGRESSFAALPDSDALAAARAAAAAVTAARDRAQKAQAACKGALCDFNGVDQLTEGIGAVLTNASFELGLAADLPGRADNCVKQADCAARIEGIRGLLQNGTIELAETRAQEARGSGCNLGALDAEFLKYRTLRDAVSQLNDALRQCQFRSGLDFAGRLPGSYASDQRFAAVLAQLRAGDAAQKLVEDSIAQATAAAVRGNDISKTSPTNQAGIQQHFAQGEGFIARAEQTAAQYPCLMDRVNRYKAEFQRLKASTYLKPTDQVPDVLGGTPRTPTSEVPPALGAPVPPRRPPAVTPTDDVPGALGSTPTSRAPAVRPPTTTQPAVTQPTVTQPPTGSGSLEGTEWIVRWDNNGQLDFATIGIRNGQIYNAYRSTPEQLANVDPQMKDVKYTLTGTVNGVRLQWESFLSPQKSPDGRIYWSSSNRTVCSADLVINGSSRALRGTCTVYATTFGRDNLTLDPLPPQTIPMVGRPKR